MSTSAWPTRRSTSCSPQARLRSWSAEPGCTFELRWPTSTCLLRRSPGARERWESVYDDEGGERAHELLAERDPEAAAAVHPNDRRRVVRALELAESGASLRSGRNRLWTEETRHPTVVFGLDLPREELDRRIEERAQEMFAAGARAEVERALQADVSDTARYALGLAELAEHPDDDVALEALDSPDEALRVLPAQMDAAHSGPC